MTSEGLTTQTNASNKIALINEHLTGPPAEELLERCGLVQTHTDSSIRLLDNASGIGTLIFRLLEKNPNLIFERLIAADIDDNYVAYARERAMQTKIADVFEARKLNQQAPGLDDTSFDYIFNNFGVFFAPNDGAVLSETLRMLKPRGTAGFTSWAKIAWWDEVLLPALKHSLPDAPPLPHPTLAFPSKGWTDPETIQTKLESASFVDIRSETWSFVPDVDPKDFALACAHLVKAMTGRVWDSDARARFEPKIEQAFLDYLHETYEGGRWTGKMTAVLTWGKRA